MLRDMSIWNKLYFGLNKGKKRRNNGRETCRQPADRRQVYLAGAAFCFLAAVLISMVTARSSEEALSSRISPQVLRFHVLANSDSQEDQALKLEVKQMLLSAMYEELNQTYSGLTMEASSPLSKGITKKEISRYINTKKEELEEKAERFISERGYSYSVSIRLEKCFFPTKVYGDVVFPCGVYDAVRVLIGEGEGKNWWCVLYPPLCFTDNAYGIVPDSSKEELKGLLDEDDFNDLMKNRRVVFEGPLSTSQAPAQGKNSQAGREKPNSVSSTEASGEEPKVTVQVRFRLLDILTGRD